MNEEERYAEQARRERRTWTWVLVACLVITAIIGAFGWRFVTPRLDAARQLDHAVKLVRETQTALTAFDAAARAASASPTTETASALAALEPRLATARAELASSTADIDAGIAHLADEEQRTAELVRLTAEARIAEIDAGAAIVSAAKTAAVSPSPANTAALQTLVTGTSSAYPAAKQKAADADAALKAL